ncbi:hypothetical protein KSP39_PZI003638 [Platanthera zijinensis]|uniref:Uncharacterized protein n=1 Tax=Platanthera zijinensis TaxID=2320716 RepID=A0AAP0BW13_9ASPA
MGAPHAWGAVIQRAPTNEVTTRGVIAAIAVITPAIAVVSPSSPLLSSLANYTRGLDTSNPPGLQTPKDRDILRNLQSIGARQALHNHDATLQCPRTTVVSNIPSRPLRRGHTARPWRALEGRPPSPPRPPGAASIAAGLAIVGRPLCRGLPVRGRPFPAACRVWERRPPPPHRFRAVVRHGRAPYWPGVESFFSSKMAICAPDRTLPLTGLIVIR